MNAVTANNNVSCIRASSLGENLDSVRMVQDGGYLFARYHPWIASELLKEDAD